MKFPTIFIKNIINSPLALFLYLYVSVICSSVCVCVFASVFLCFRHWICHSFFLSHALRPLRQRLSQGKSFLSLFPLLKKEKKTCLEHSFTSARSTSLCHFVLWIIYFFCWYKRIDRFWFFIHNAHKKPVCDEILMLALRMSMCTSVFM